jgi:phage baseplate assembly protein V
LQNEKYVYEEDTLVFRVGLVEAQDAANCRLRVTFPDRDQMTSWWLPIVIPKSQNDKAYWLPDIGEQVVCMMDERDEDGAVLSAIYSQADTTPVQDSNKVHWSFKDGTAIEYDRGNHVLSFALPQATLTIQASGASITIDGQGNVTITPSGQILLGGSAAARGVARLGDSVVCPAGTGTITTSSTIALAD